MRAIAFDDFGQTPWLQDLQVPPPGLGEVRVRVQTSSVNGSDVLVAAGATRGILLHRFPLTLGRDFAGTIDAVGPGVAGFAVGDDVFGVVTKSFIGDGAFADFVTVPVTTAVARRPAGLTVREAGALGLAGVAAERTIDALRPSHGEGVLIAGASGGVGSFAVQLAAARGARVIATAKPGPEVEYVRRLGAVDTMNPESVADDLPRVAREDISAVAHFAGDAPNLARLLPRGGRFASILGIDVERLRGLGLVVNAIHAAPSPELLGRLGTMVAEGRLRIPVHKVYALEQVPQALVDLADGGKLGKLSVSVAP